MNISKLSFPILLFILVLSNSAFGSTFSGISNNDQDTLKSYVPTAGKRAISININPVFTYLGNMFNGSTGNSLDISAANVLYRKFKENNIVKRYRLNFGISTNESSLINSNSTFPFRLDAGTRRSFSSSLSFAYGKEKRYNYRKLSLYTGWEIISGVSHYSSSYNYDYNDGDFYSIDILQQNLTRIKSGPSYTGVSVGVAGILGAEYYFSKMFFVGMELSVPFILSITREEGYKYERANVIWPENVVRVTDELSDDARNLISGSIRSTDLIQFRAGITF